MIIIDFFNFRFFLNWNWRFINLFKNKYNFYLNNDFSDYFHFFYYLDIYNFNFSWIFIYIIKNMKRDDNYNKIIIEFIADREVIQDDLSWSVLCFR